MSHSRRSLLGALGGMAALLPLSGWAKDSVDGFPQPNGSGMGLPPLTIWEEHTDLVLDGELVPVHHIHMNVFDGLDGTGGIAVLFDIPSDRQILDGGPQTALPANYVHHVRSRRIVLTLFEYNPQARCIVGEEVYDADTGEIFQKNPGDTLEERLGDVIKAARTSGVDAVPDFTKGYAVWVTQDGPGYEHPKHAMAYLPYKVSLDDMTTIVPIRMVKASVTRA